MSILHRILTHPLARGLDIDDPRTTELRIRIIQQKKFLRHIYDDWYRLLRDALPAGPGAVLELGSGAGYLKDFIPGLITSEVLPTPNVRLLADATKLPFADGALRGIVMSNVLHHIPDARAFFMESARCIRSGGVIAMIEPWVSWWSKLIYTKLHHEPFEPKRPGWDIPMGGPLSGANGALPWILFSRDRAQFEKEFPQWRIRQVEPFMPISYVLSGGVSLRSVLPGWAYPVMRAVEFPFDRNSAMFAKVVVERAA